MLDAKNVKRKCKFPCVTGNDKWFFVKFGDRLTGA